jgi:parallel beta-helix repeat protein
MNRPRLLRATVVIALATFAYPALGADCGDTTGPGGADVPCNCGDEATTSTTLQKSDSVVSTGLADFCPLVDVGKPALRVAAGVDLNLNKLHVRGGLQACGIQIEGSGVTVRNGTLSHFLAGSICTARPPDFPLGETYNGHDNLTILDIVAPDNFGSGVLILGGKHHRIEGVRTAGGIVIGPQSTELPEDVTISGNIVTSLGGSGRATGSIGFIACNKCVARNNVVRSASAGIFFVGSEGVIQENEVEDVTLEAFKVGGNSNTIRGNTAKRAQYGLFLQGDGNTVTGNEAARNLEGIIVGGSGNAITGNEATKNLRNGLIALAAPGQAGNIDGGGNSGRDNDPEFEQCSIDGNPCQP